MAMTVEITFFWNVKPWGLVVGEQPFSKCTTLHDTVHTNILSPMKVGNINSVCHLTHSRLVIDDFMIVSDNS